MRFKSSVLPLAVAAIFAILLVAGCKPVATHSSYAQVNLVSDISFAGARIDSTLLNAWGIAFDPAGNISVAANHTSSSEFYTWDGSTAQAGIGIPGPLNPSDGAPSGQVYNNTTGFMIPGTSPTATKFIFVGEDGVVSAWTSGATATRMATGPDSTTVYKGCAIATDAGQDYLYCANFKDKRVDVYDKDFTLVTGRAFSDPTVPADYGPFNIANIGGNLYVSYAMPKAPDFMDDSAGAGHGYLAVFSPDGVLQKHLYSQGVLNSPWGIAKAPAAFGEFSSDILVGNFGDGNINAFDANGAWQGTLKDKDSVDISISGLWGITDGLPGYANWLYFTAGPNHEAHGLFGYLKMN